MNFGHFFNRALGKQWNLRRKIDSLLLKVHDIARYKVGQHFDEPMAARNMLYQSMLRCPDTEFLYALHWVTEHHYVESQK